MENELFEPTCKVKDLGLGNFLFTTDHELIETILESPRTVYFVFRKRQDTDRIITSYFNGTGQAPARKLMENLRTLKGLIYARTNNAR